MTIKNVYMEILLKIQMWLLDYNDKVQKERGGGKVVLFVLPFFPEVRTWLNELTIILHFRMLLKMKRKISLSFFCHSLEVQAVLPQIF